MSSLSASSVRKRAIVRFDRFGSGEWLDTETTKMGVVEAEGEIADGTDSIIALYLAGVESLEVEALLQCRWEVSKNKTNFRQSQFHCRVHYQFVCGMSKR